MIQQPKEIRREFQSSLEFPKGHRKKPNTRFCLSLSSLLPSYSLLLPLTKASLLHQRQHSFPFLSLYYSSLPPNLSPSFYHFISWAGRASGGERGGSPSSLRDRKLSCRLQDYHWLATAGQIMLGLLQ